MKENQNQPTNPRARRRREQRRLLAIVVAFLVVGGSVAIGLSYGPRAVLTGALCLLAGAGVLSVLWLILRLLERWAEE